MIRRSDPRSAMAAGLDRVLETGPASSPASLLGTAPRAVDRVRVGIVALGSVLTLAACGTEGDATEQPPPAPSASESSAAPTSADPSMDPDEVAAADAAMAVYRDVTRLVQDARRDPTQDWLPAYAQLTADPYRSAELLEVSALRDRGIAHTGEVAHDPEVAAVDLAGGTDGTLRTVTIQDCVDTQDFPATVQATGDVVSAERPPHVAVATVVFYPQPEDRWLVATVDVQDETC
ncbi:hypothetical protein SAMN05660748_0069 [Blastococcus aggregatus]|uniref:Uncharacterized protein n=2 Tax=Blastococcus aggregatus TaxID=38502 RepID=A0A285V0T9_9ACTN|nr:hypothetical protein SAMN05660748_0069 [Blastococcus aggregatus]